jgi:hypothetical protein
MAAHTLQPSGLVLRLGIADLSGATPEILGGTSAGINPWSVTFTSCFAMQVGSPLD